MAFIKAHKVSIFRKVALSAWGGGGDPSVYGFLEVDVTDGLATSSPMPVVIKALSGVMKKHKELNSILRFGRLYYRKHINISVLVNIVENEKHDLSIATLENVDQLTLAEIERSISVDAGLIRRRKDPKLGFALRLIHQLPWFMTKTFLRLYALATHDLNLNMTKLRFPRHPFGSVIITNVGSLGIKKALVPLVPLTRAALLLSVGEVTKEARVIGDQICIRQIMHLGVTFDHRFFDGAQAAIMIRDFEALFASLNQKA